MKTKEKIKTRPIPTRFRDLEVERIDLASSMIGINNRSALIKLCVHIVLPQIEAGEIKVPQQSLGA